MVTAQCTMQKILKFTKNIGNIYNCFVKNAYVSGELNDKNNNASAFCNAGGIAGYNNGVISQCSTENSTIISYLTAKTDSGDNNYATAGGIVGNNVATGKRDSETNALLDGIVKDSVSHNNKLIRADARGDGKNDDKRGEHNAKCGAKCAKEARL